VLLECTGTGLAFLRALGFPVEPPAEPAHANRNPGPAERPTASAQLRLGDPHRG
jgi:hypothetical protein